MRSLTGAERLREQGRTRGHRRAKKSSARMHYGYGRENGHKAAPLEMRMFRRGTVAVHKYLP